MRILWMIGLGCAAHRPTGEDHPLHARQIDPGVPEVVRAAEPVRVQVEREGQPGELLFAAVIAAGSAYDPLGREGLASLVAESIWAGGAGNREPAEVEAALAAVEGRPAVAVGRELVTVTLRCPAANAAACVELFGDALGAPRFSSAAVGELAKGAVLTLTSGLAQDPDRLAREVLDVSLFEGHPYGHPIAGRTGVVALLGPKELRAFHASHYARSTTAVGIAGDVAAADVAALSQRLLALGTTLRPDLPLYAPPALGRGTVLAVEGLAGGPAYRLGLALPIGESAPDWPALWVGIRALATQLGSAPPEVPRPGSARRYAELSLPVPLTALGSARGTLEGWATLGPSEDQIEAARAEVLSDLQALAQDPQVRLLFALEAAASRGPDRLIEGTRATEALTAEDVSVAIEREVDRKGMSLVAVGSDASAWLTPQLDPATSVLAAPSPGRSSVLPLDGLFR